MSNVYQIASVLQTNYEIFSKRKHITDNKREIQQTLEKEIDEKDLIILSGGVSKGKFDFIPEVLEELRVEKLFHRVNKDQVSLFWFGTHPNGCVVFALPGNPISSFMCAEVYLKSWIEKSLSIHGPMRRWLF